MTTYYLAGQDARPPRPRLTGEMGAVRVSDWEIVMEEYDRTKRKLALADTINAATNPAIYGPKDPKPSGAIIGLSGYASSGKDTAAGILTRYGWQRVAFADKMKEMLYRLDPVLPSHANVRLAGLVDRAGWSTVKEVCPEVRHLLQRLGTDAGRNVLGEDVWVNAALRDLQPGGRYVVTDVRFPNEAEAITARGGYVLRIVRPGTGPANGHPSETAMDGYGFDGFVCNAESLSVLEYELLGELERLGIDQ